ncbi:interferon phi 3 [Pseudorasbora parva]|uniref:interferon phi 3 n=1 Tax=Pseudorasbora parva TaxID=51549 RepID=UPI00351DBB9C
MDLHRVAWMCAFFCFAQVWSLPTNCILRKDLMGKTCTLIESAGGLFPSQCLDDHVSIYFPQNVFESNNSHQVTGVEKAVYQTLQNIDALFEDHTVPDQWDADKMTEFRGIVYRQIEESKCIMSKSEVEQDFPSRDASLKVYFEAISSTLKEKDFSYCAWEIVRGEILRTLNFILKHNSDIMYGSPQL